MTSEPPHRSPWEPLGGMARVMLAAISVLAGLITAVPTIVRGVAPVWLVLAAGGGVLLLVLGIGLSRRETLRRTHVRVTEVSAGEPVRRERGALGGWDDDRGGGPTAARRERRPLREFGDDSPSASPSRDIDEVYVSVGRQERTRPGRRRSTLAVRGATAGGAALILAILTGIGTTIASDVTSAAHIAQQSGAPPSETCTEAVKQVSALARQNPRVAARYARGEAGLPRLVEPDVQRRCGGSFRALLQPATRRTSGGR